MHLYIKPENDDVSKYYKDNSGKTESLYNLAPDAGLDLYSPEQLVIPAKSMGKLNLKIKCEALNNKTDPPTSRRCSYYLFPRSSITKTPLRLANSVGIIDSGYRGNIIACLDNISDSDYVIEKGTRLVQLCSPNLSPVSYDLVECEDKTCECLLSNTERGKGGFGSTGK